jgi:hypothetical protein
MASLLLGEILYSVCLKIDNAYPSFQKLVKRDIICRKIKNLWIIPLKKVIHKYFGVAVNAWKNPWK